ncbi:40s ribosomal s8 [Trichoderma arundinaceum]|uniref:40s ribosomal s8 n=1 Tax=Trichoderma arundinaceum TaxID=490622 RepID=A0A395NBS8_TRIAR|nr:40s ribosomal s8 [Trichoderma arundinaceum]
MQPPNAAANPSARYSRKGQAPNRLTKNQSPIEVASWSQSKRWLSSETRERKAFQKMMLNLQFMKADQSPFVPKTPAELTRFKISLAESKRQKLAQEVSILEEKTRQRELAKASGSKLVSQPQALLFKGREMGDKLSPVFAARNCFNKEDTAGVNHRVEWPSLAELKEEGDKRARFGRYLPLPRMNVVAPRVLEREQESAYNADGSIL